MMPVAEKILKSGGKLFAWMEQVNSNGNFLKIFKTIIVLLVLSYFFIVIGGRIDPDFGWHIKVGDWILQNRQVPRTDEFSHTMYGYQWIDHEWAMNALLFAAIENNLGLLVNFAFSLLATIPFAYWIFRARSYASFFPLLIGVFAISSFVAVRPAVISFVLFFVLYEILNARYGQRGFKRGPYFFAAILLFIWFWANIHAGFIVGIALVCLFVISDHGERFFYSRKFDVKKFGGDICLVAGCFLVSLINPYGYGVFEEILRIMRSSEVYMYIMEWRSGFFQ